MGRASGAAFFVTRALICIFHFPRPHPSHRLRAMFTKFFHDLKSAGLPVSLREYLTLMQAMDADLASRKVEDFYYLSRSTLVKDERNLDKFDRVFAHVFKGVESVAEGVEAEIPEEWLKLLTEKYFTEEARDRSAWRMGQANGDAEEAS